MAITQNMLYSKKKQGHRFTTISLFHLTKLTKYNEAWSKAAEVYAVGRSPPSPVIHNRSCNLTPQADSGELPTFSFIKKYRDIKNPGKL